MVESTYSYLPYQTARLRFRQPTKDDMPLARERVMDPLCVVHLPHLNHQNHTLDSCWEWCELQQEKASTGEAFFVVIERLDTGRVIGDGGFASEYGLWWQDANGQHVAPEEAQKGTMPGLKKFGEIGCMIESSSDVRGKGFGEEIMRGLLDLGFGRVSDAPDRKNFGCDVIRVCTRKANAPMVGLCLNRLRLQPQEKVVDGVEEVWFETTAEEWRRHNP